MRIRFWGVRGSIPTPGPGTVRYGGNTSCVEVRADDGTVLVLDCGSGARELGGSLLGDGAPPAGAPRAVLIGHTHWDHIHGLPFFAPLFAPGEWAMYGPRGLGQSLVETLSGQMQYTYFPVTLDDLVADVVYHDLVEGEFSIGDVRIRTQYLNHPALTLGYRIEADGRSVVYAVDHEPFDPSLGAGGDLSTSTADARHVDFLAGADVVIHDSQYLASEYPDKVGWGHSTVEYAVDAGVAAGCEQLVLTHHDPARDDEHVDEVVALARQRAEAAGRCGVVHAAAEGWEIDLPARSTSALASPPASSPAVLEDAMTRMADDALLAIGDPVVRSTVLAAVEAEHLTLHDDLVSDEVLGDRTVVFAESGDDIESLASVLEQCGPDTAVLGLTRSLPAPAARVVDWIVWPSTVAHVRTKLRAALLRRACRWQAAPLPDDELKRLAALHELDVLDTGPEERFDRFTAEACEVLGVPIALVSLVDENRQWFKSKVGLDAEETPRDMAVCAHAILGPRVFMVPDLMEDARFADNPIVVGDPRLRSYAGVPLELSDGSRIGTFCVLDHRPRDFNDKQVAELQRLAAGVLEELESS